MLCENISCNKRDNKGGCSIYSPAGMMLRDRLGYCPIVDMPRKEATTHHIRTGQQKSKVKKHG